MVQQMKINQGNTHIKKMKEKSTSSQLMEKKSSLQNSTSFHDNNTQQIKNRRKLPQHNIKAIYEKSIPNIILKGERLRSLEDLRAFPLTSGTRKHAYFSPFLFNIVLEVLLTAIRQKKKKEKKAHKWERKK